MSQNYYRYLSIGFLSLIASNQYTGWSAFAFGALAGVYGVIAIVEFFVDRSKA